MAHDFKGVLWDCPVTEAKELLAAGADPNKVDSHGRTPLHMVWSKDVAEVLLAAGAEVDKPNSEGETPLCRACYAGYTGLAKVLLGAGADFDKLPLNGSSKLHWASRAGLVEMVQSLLEGGSEVNGEDADGRTPLHIASKAEQREVVELLLTSGAEVDWVDNEGRSPLGHLFYDEYPSVGNEDAVDICLVLLEAGADVNLGDYASGCTPFSDAIFYFHEDAAVMMMKRCNPSLDGLDDMINIYDLYWWLGDDIQRLEEELQCKEAKMECLAQWCDAARKRRDAKH